MNKELNKLICNLIGATEVLEIAYINGDLKSTMLALKRIEELTSGQKALFIATKAIQISVK